MELNKEFNLDPFKLDLTDALDLNQNYQEVSHNLILDALTKKIAEELIIDKKIDPVETGVYFWILELEGKQYKVYIGRTKSLIRRLSDYTSTFQIHSPNDYKLRFFQEFIYENYKNANFSLFFRKCSKNDYTEIETSEIQRYKPLINLRAQVSVEEKNKIKKAFRSYYESVFISKL